MRNQITNEVKGFVVILCDLSGTLVDDLKITWSIVCDILEYFGKPSITLVEFQESFHLPFYKIFHDCGIEGIPNNKFVKLYKEFFPKYADKASLFGEVRRFLNKCSQLGKKIAIASQTPREQIDYYVEKFKIAEFFSAIVSLEDCVELKPAPLSLLIAAEHLSIDPNQVIYIGDMAEDIIAAKDARMIPVGIYRQFGSYNMRIQLLRARPHAIISSLEEVFDFAN